MAPYRLSFTSGGLFIGSAGKAAALYLEHRDWGRVRRDLDADNLLQARTVASARRLGRELVQRLCELSDAELVILADADSDERAHLMWAATCRRYALIGEFASEVVRDRYLGLETQLQATDFDAFVRGKALWHEELHRLAASTARKLQTSTFLMLREAQMLTGDGLIVPAIISGRVMRELRTRIPTDTRFFTMKELP